MGHYKKALVEQQKVLLDMRFHYLMMMCLVDDDVITQLLFH